MQAILHQLYKAQGSLAKHASKHLTSGHSLDNLATLWEIFTRSVSDSHAKPTLCFIDALDECEPVSREQLIRLMLDSFVTWGDGPVAKILIKILITSRPDNSIKVAFNKAQNQVKLGQSRSPQSGETSGPFCSMIRLRGEDETEAITRDIELVVKAAINGLVVQGFPEKLLTDIMAELIDRADRTFLWTTLIIRLLQERTEAGASQRDLRAILQSRSVDAIYTELLKARKDPKKARKMLQIMIAAIRPLTVAELSVALAVHPDHDTFAVSESSTRPSLQTFDNVNSDLVYPLENHVKALGGHFVRIIKERVYFVHETAREFLLRPTAQYRNAATTPTCDARSPNLQGSEEMSGLFEIELGEEAPVFSGNTINDTDNHAMAEGLPLSPFNDYSNSGHQCIVEEGSVWQHTFSFSVSHALLLEVCVTYLYCLAKNSKSGERGQPPTGNIGEFFRYAAKSWISHFHRVRTRIPSNALPYYYGLCHPKFHGFRVWIQEVGLNPQTMLSGALGSTEDVQDRLLRLFQLDPDDVDLSRSGNDIDDDPIDTTEIAGPAGLPDVNSIRIRALSSNPSAQRVHNFPTHVDEFGFVSLRPKQE
ncbi:hypothetical protein PENSUB_6105 [Penicillium subrubescens]|uniref:Vegetative incompatibility protein HET-E-1 n=2 Tax=Penicillium subrubescens TaxID=1316194 RepID=A0A1Q5U3W5_9EURO|nr:hypothetical protein PENSUB_6105 [Penicillium subrubescens]